MKQNRQPLIDLEPVPVDLELPGIDLELPAVDFELPEVREPAKQSEATKE